MDLSIIVPCYNEADSIEEFYDLLKETFKNKKIDYELIFVDDGSDDETLKKLKEIKDKKIKIINFSRNFGKEAAMLAGMKHANGNYISIMDADLQHSPQTLLDMYNKLLDNKEFDMVAAYKENRDDELPLKSFLTSMFYRINNRISEVKLLPGASDFRVFKKSVNEAIISMPERRRFLKGMFSWVGFNTIYMPYKPSKRLHGNSKWSIYKLLKYSFDGIISFSTFPLRLSFFVGVIILFIGVFNFLLMGHLSHRTIILILSFIMFFLGTLSIYLKRVYCDSLNRPYYIIKEMIGFDTKKN